MKNLLTRRHLIQTGLACGLSMALPSARSCQLTMGNFVLVHPWARATAPDATEASVCMGFEEVNTEDWLIGASSPVAESAEMGGEGERKDVRFRIAKGQSSALSEAGTYLRLVGLKFPLEAGRSFPLTLVFEKAGTTVASLSVDYSRFG
jgi:copper(I)-binding protein